jgi:hypothetical protein
MALNACPFHRHPVPIKCPPPPPPFPSFPQTREYTRAPRSLVRIRHCRRHNLFEFGRHREVSPLVSGPYSSPSSGAPSDVLRFSYSIVNRRIRSSPKARRRQSSSGRVQAPLREAIDFADHAPEISSPFYASSWSPSPPRTSRMPTMSTPSRTSPPARRNPSLAVSPPLLPLLAVRSRF